MGVCVPGQAPTLQHQGRDTCDSSKETVPHSLSSKERGKMTNIAVVTCLLQVLLHYLIATTMYCHQEKQHIFKTHFKRKQGRKVRKNGHLMIKNSLVTSAKESSVKYEVGACLQVGRRDSKRWETAVSSFLQIIWQ